MLGKPQGQSVVSAKVDLSRFQRGTAFWLFNLFLGLFFFSPLVEWSLVFLASWYLSFFSLSFTFFFFFLSFPLFYISGYFAFMVSVRPVCVPDAQRGH